MVHLKPTLYEVICDLHDFQYTKNLHTGTLIVTRGHQHRGGVPSSTADLVSTVVMHMVLLNHPMHLQVVSLMLGRSAATRPQLLNQGIVDVHRPFHKICNQHPWKQVIFFHVVSLCMHNNNNHSTVLSHHTTRFVNIPPCSQNMIVKRGKLCTNNHVFCTFHSTWYCLQ